MSSSTSPGVDIPTPERRTFLSRTTPDFAQRVNPATSLGTAFPDPARRVNTNALLDRIALILHDVWILTLFFARTALILHGG